MTVPDLRGSVIQSATIKGICHLSFGGAGHAFCLTRKQLVELAAAVPGPYEERVTVEIGPPEGEFRVSLRSAYDWVLVFQRQP